MTAGVRSSRKKRNTGSAEPGLVAEIVRRIVKAARPEKIILFGSAARREMGPNSDLDFLVEFDSRAPDALSLKTFFGLKESLEALFGRNIDLVEPGAIRNPYLNASIERSREPVFEA